MSVTLSEYDPELRFLNEKIRHHKEKMNYHEGKKEILGDNLGALVVLPINIYHSLWKTYHSKRLSKLESEW
ncbi:hypothetical protein HYZ41_01865 [archaeon]|nr:hypothetical protein [archaeon]